MNVHSRHLTKAGLVLLVLATIVSTIGADSIFSINGLGEIIYPVGGRARGLGGLNIAMLDGKETSMVNPAIIGTVDTTTVSGLFQFEQRRIKDASSKSTVYSWRPRYFRLIIPIGKGFTAAGGLAPYSIVNHHLTTETEIFDAPYELRVSGDGGIHMGSITVAKNIADRVYIGSCVNLLFGSIEEVWTRDFDDPDFVDSEDALKTRYYGQLYHGGIAIRLHRNITLGALYTTSGNFQGTILQTTASDTLYEREAQIDFPHAYGIGATYRLSRRFRIGADIYTRLWEEYRVDGQSFPQYKNATRYAFGIDLAPTRDKGASTFAKMPWRAGFYTTTGYYESASGNRVSESFVSLGTSLVFRENRGVFDISLEVGKRGTIADNGAQEWVFRQTLSITGWEQWFHNREY